MKKVYAIVVGLMLLAAPAFAADVDGKWSGTVSTPMGDIPVAYEFKADGTTLSGTTLGIDGGSVPIKDGKSRRQQHLVQRHPGFWRHGHRPVV